MSTVHEINQRNAQRKKRQRWIRRKQRFVDWIGPWFFGKEYFVPHAKRISLEDTAKHLGMSVRQLQAQWIDTGVLATRQHWGGEIFTTRQWVESAMLELKMFPRAER